MESLGQLAGGIAHDFNNLLGAILGNASLLMDSDNLDGEDQESLEQIIVASNRSADLTRQLLSFSRKGKLRHSVLDLHVILGEVAALLTRSIDRRISISLQLEAERPFVDGDPSMLHNALLNLGVNARDAMSKLPSEVGLNDQLVLSTTEIYLDKKSASLLSEQLLPGWYVQIVVSDTGCGIDPKIMDKIFEPFFTTKEEGKGTGLGLAGVYGCIKSHKGSLTVKSKPNTGTSFTILLPRSQDTAKPAPTEGTPVVGQGGRILFVDDDEILRQTMSRTLDRLGYESITCSDGLEAVEYYSENHAEIDLIVLDLIMARMGGEEAFYRLMQINPEAKILISSGFARNNLVEELIREGACGFLGKPFNMHELAKALAANITV